MSQVFLESVGLDELVFRSPLILVVRRDNPPIETEVTEIHPDKERYPPYVATLDRFIVEEVLKGKRLAADQALTVRQANSAWDLELHKQYYIHRMSESPIYDAYKPGNVPGEDAVLIVFLSERDDGSYEYSMIGACEGMSSKSTVLDSIGRGWSPSSDDFDPLLLPDWDR